MPNPDDPLWQSLENFRIGEPDASLSFSSRLAEENGWPSSYADRVERQYKRFLYLAIQADHAVTPSDQVDQAWHLHLAYTQSYWDDLCGTILKKPLHHNPTEGGPEQKARFIDQYERTLESYRRIFGEEAPADIWPPAGRRFSERFRRVNLAKKWVVPRPSVPREWAFFLVVVCLVLAFVNHQLTASSDVQNVTDHSIGPLTYFLVGIAAMFLIMPKTTNRTAKRRRGDSPGCGSGCTADSGCGGGGGGCGGGD